MRTISGIVTPAQWDDQDRVVAVLIATDEEEEILVDDGPEAGELIVRLREEVSVRGECYLDAKGQPHIRVHVITNR